MKRGRAIRFGRVDVRALFEQSAHGSAVAVPGRVDQRRAFDGSGAHQDGKPYGIRRSQAVTSFLPASTL